MNRISLYFKFVRLIEQLGETIKSKDALINQLQTEKTKNQDCNVDPYNKVQELTETALKRAGEIDVSTSYFINCFL